MSKNKDKTSKINCHHGNTPVFKYGKATFYAGGWTRGMKAIPNGIVIDLTGDKYSSVKKDNVGPIRVYDDASQEMFDDVLKTREQPVQCYWLTFEIRDFGIPTWGLPTWIALAETLKREMDKGIDVVVGCLGGHGRTGIALSILGPLMGIIDAKSIDPIQWARDAYCDHAVERQTQADYVYEMVSPDFPKDLRTKIVDPVATSTQYGYWEGGKWNSTTGATKPKTKYYSSEYCQICHEKKIDPIWKAMGLKMCSGCYDKEKKEMATVYKTPENGDCIHCEKKYRTDMGNLNICDECIGKIEITLAGVESPPITTGVWSYVDPMTGEMIDLDLNALDDEGLPKKSPPRPEPGLSGFACDTCGHVYDTGAIPDLCTQPQCTGFVHYYIGPKGGL